MSVKTSAAEKLATGKIAIDAEFWFHGEGVLDFVTNFDRSSATVETGYGMRHCHSDTNGNQRVIGIGLHGALVIAIQDSSGKRNDA